MKVLVLGATGGTGRLIVRDALARPFRRGPGSKASADLPGVDMIEGDARDEDTLIHPRLERLRWRRQLVEHRPEPVPQDQPAPRRNRRPGHGDDAQRRAPSGLHQRRGGSGTASCGDGGFVFDRLFLPLLLSHAHKDKDGQEAAIRASSLDWVIVRPPCLPMTQLVGASGLSMTSQASMAARLHAPMSLGSW